VRADYYSSQLNDKILFKISQKKMEQKTQEVHEEMIAFIKEYTFKMLQQPSSSQTLLNVLSKILLQKLKVYGKEMVT